MKKNRAMSVVVLLVLAWMVPPAIPAPGPPGDPYGGFGDLILQASRETGVDTCLIAAVIKQSSAFNPGARDNAGNIGLMLLTPEIVQALGVSDAADPKQNIMAGARHLALLLFNYDGDATKAVAAFQAGPGLVDQYDGVPPNKEIQSFVRRVMQARDEFARLAASGAVRVDMSRWAGTWAQGPYRYAITVSGAVWSATFQATVSGDATHSRLTGKVSNIRRDGDAFVGDWESAFVGSENTSRQTGTITLRLVPGEVPNEDRLEGSGVVKTDQAGVSAGQRWEVSLERD